MKLKSNKKIIPAVLTLALIFAMIPFSSACGVPNSVKKEAEEYKAQHEGAFRKKVEAELGPDYKLSGVECEIIDTETRGYVFDPQGGVSPGSRYMASNSLKGKIEHGGETYDVEYYVRTDKLSTDALYPEIIGDLATTLGLDKNKIVFGDLVGSIDYKHELIDSNIRTVKAFLDAYHGSGWFFIIVTGEDISNKETYYDYSPLLHELKMDRPFNVEIYSSDNVTDMDHLKTNYGKISWATPQMFNKNNRLTLPDYMEGEKDVFTRYNFKNAARIEYYTYGMSVSSY